MSSRAAGIIVLLFLIWTSFGYCVTAWLQLQHERCSKFGDLSGECFAPVGLAALLLSTVFVIATGALAWLAFRK